MVVNLFLIIYAYIFIISFLKSDLAVVCMYKDIAT